MKGTNADGKFDYITYDPDGKGNNVRIDMDDAAAIFSARQAMEVDPARAMAELRGLKKEVRSLAMSMLDVQFKGAGLANDVSSKLFSQDMAERRLAQDAAADKARIGLGYAGLNQRADEMNRTHPVLSKEDRAALLKIESAWYEATDPKAKAELWRQHQMVQSRAALSMGKTLGLPTDRGARGPTEVKAADVLKMIDYLKADPAHQGKTVDELWPIAAATIGGGGAPNPYAAAWGPQADAPNPAAPTMRNGGTGLLETTKTPDGRTMYRQRGQQQWHTSEGMARSAAIDSILQRNRSPEAYTAMPGEEAY